MIYTGFEFECIAGDSDLYDNRTDYHSGESYNDWYRVESDGSLSSYGVEIISDKLTPDKHDDAERSFIDTIEDGNGVTVDSSCGFHVSFSDSEMPIQSLFLYPVLLELRKGLYDLIPKEQRKEYKREYNRSYARTMRGYSDYRRTRYLEFNIRRNYIEWRGVHVRHLIGYKDTELAIRVFRFYRQVDALIRYTLEKYYHERKQATESIRITEFNFISLHNQYVQVYNYSKIRNVQQTIGQATYSQSVPVSVRT